jgi:hypothetical protein
MLVYRRFFHSAQRIVSTSISSVISNMAARPPSSTRSSAAATSRGYGKMVRERKSASVRKAQAASIAKATSRGRGITFGKYLLFVLVYVYACVCVCVCGVCVFCIPSSLRWIFRNHSHSSLVMYCPPCMMLYQRNLWVSIF